VLLVTQTQSGICSSVSTQDSLVPRKIELYGKYYTLYGEEEDRELMECMITRKSYIEEMRMRTEMESILQNQIDGLGEIVSKYREKYDLMVKMVDTYEFDLNMLKGELKRSERRRKVNKILMYSLVAVFTLGIGLLLILKR